MHSPLLKGYLINIGKFLLGVYENRHHVTCEPKTKDVLHAPHAEDDNRITAHRQAVPGCNPPRASTPRRDFRIKPPAPAPTPTLLEPSPWSPHLPQPKYASWERSTPP